MTWQVFFKNRNAQVGLFLVVLLVFVGGFAPYLAPHSPVEQNLDRRLLPPAWQSGDWRHPLGTDEFGRDMLSRLIFGARISLQIGIYAVGLALAIGLLLGSLGGYFGGVFDHFVMFVINLLLSVPSLLLAVFIVAVTKPSLENAILAISIVSIPTYARLVRAQVLEEKQKEYVTASQLMGASHFRLIFFVILPNCLGPVLVQATMNFGAAVLEAAGLSFLGLGAQPPTPEWGAMLSETLQFLHRAPHLVLLPGLCIFIAVVGFNLLGDGLSEVLDPRGKRR